MEFKKAKISYEDSAMGKMEHTIKAQAGNQLAEIEKLRSDLKKMHDDFDNYRAEQAAYQAAKELREQAAEKRELWRNILSNGIAAIIGGLVVYYWPSIVSFVASLFHG